MASQIEVRPRKRMRFDSPATDATDIGEDNAQESGCEDRTIVLKCVGGGKLVAPMSFLADRSPVFRDMFNFPQPSATSVSEGSPRPIPSVVDLTDSFEDVYELLRVLVPAEGSSKLFSSHMHPTFDTVSACIRLGHKYQIEYVVQEGIDYLRNYFPCNFEAYQELLTPGVPPEFDPIHAIGVVNLARLTDANAILPTAIMKCSALPGSKLIAGFKRRDGSLETLSPQDLALCFEAKGALMREYVRRAAALARRVPSPDCSLAAMNMECRGGVAVVEEIERQASGLTVANILDRLDWKSLLEGLGGYEGHPCSKCVRALEKREKEYLQDTWNRLPELVGVQVEDWVRKEVCHEYM